MKKNPQKLFTKEIYMKAFITCNTEFLSAYKILKKCEILEPR